MKRLSVIPILIISLLYSCNSSQADKKEVTFFKQDTLKILSEATEVIYSLSLPTDMAFLLEKSGYNFNPSLPATTENASRYTDTSQLAVMMGVYGVDLSYCKIYSQNMCVADYYNNLRVLSNKLTVPESIFESSRLAIEHSFNNTDSLTGVIKEIYMETDSYFRNNGMDRLASLSLMGGWTEAMYIGVSLFRENQGRDMRERILQQKYALNSMISLLSNYHEDPAVVTYLLMLKKLRNQFSKVDIYYAKEGFSVDTSGHKLQSSGAIIDYKPETFDQICLIVEQIRNEIIK